MDKSKIYTAVNADELEEGDVVFVADTWAELQRRNRVQEITRIVDSTFMSRFGIGNCTYALAYLIAKHDDPYKEFKKAQAEGKKVWFQYDDGKWRADAGFCDFTSPIERYSLNPPPAKEYKVFLDAHFVFGTDVPKWVKQVYFTSTDIKAASRWCTEHNKFVDVAKAWEEGKQIQYLDDAEGWSDCEPAWNVDTEYRVKPASIEWTDLRCGDVISNGRFLSLVVCIDQGETGSHICAGSTWLTDDELKEWSKVKYE